MLQFHSRQGRNFSAFYSGDVSFKSIDGKVFRHPKMESYIYNSAFNIILVFNGTKKIGSILFENFKKVHSIFTWMTKGDISIAQSKGFAFNSSVEGHVNYDNCVNELSHFIEVRQDTGNSCSCNLEFGWLSVRCVLNDTSSNAAACQSEKWYTNETCGQMDRCAIFYSLSGTLWKSGNFEEASSIAIYSLGMH